MQNAGRWAMAVAKRHRHALQNLCAMPIPAMCDVAISLMIVHRNSAGVDWQGLLALDDRDLVAQVSYIHDNVCRKTGTVKGDLFAPNITEEVKHEA